MRLPLTVHWAYYGRDYVYDADKVRVCSHPTSERAFTLALLRKFNGDWRFRLLGRQPYLTKFEPPKNVEITVGHPRSR